MLGEKLKSARIARGMTASEVAAETRMKVQMVEALENEDFSQVAATIYGKGFIRLYAEQVGLDSAPLIEEYLTRFVAPEDGGIRSAEEEPVDEEEEQEEYEEGDIISRITSFFKSGDETAEAEPGELTREEPAAAGKTEPMELDLGGARPPEDFARKAHEVIQPEPVSRSGPEAEEEPEEEESGPSLGEILAEKYQAMTVSFDDAVRKLKQALHDKAAKCMEFLDDLIARLPDFRAFEWPPQSIPVMVTVLVVIILIVSGLSSLVRRSAKDGPVVIEEESPLPAVETTGELRVVVQPPEPYYK